MVLHCKDAVLSCAAICTASARLVYAFSRSFFATFPATSPITNRAGPATSPPSTAVPPAIPSPPAAREPPPKKASVAFVAAAPLSAEIAVPVEAKASACAAPYAPKAANAPPAVPATAPPATEPAKCAMLRSSTNSCSSI